MGTTRGNKPLFACLALFAGAGAGPASDRCGASERLHALDFWLGRWTVSWDGEDTDRWKQVWVTDRALRTGGTKEKIEVPELTTESRIRFEGRYPGQEPAITIMDRSTLTREADGSIRHLIEISSDGGKSWKATFDGRYRRDD